MVDNVVVLAKKFNLSGSQRDLLNRGLSFVPSVDIGRNHKTQCKFDLQNYHRKIKLASYFKDSKKQEPRPFMGASIWTPPMDKLAPPVIDLIEEDYLIFDKYYRPIKEIHNLAADEVRALWELKKLKQIVIKPADKGSTVVIMDREQYILEVKRQLSDTTYYKKLSTPIYLDTIPLIDDILGQLKKKKFINETQRKYLKGQLQPRERRFYILPKVHKNPKTWTIPFEVPPGRPIVSDCGSETYFTAEYLDFYLNPLSTRHTAYVKDTFHFLEIVKGLTIPPNSYLFSMDVDSLYTNIDIQRGINSVKKIFSKFPDPTRPDEELLELLKINLTRNDFVFDGEFYLQILGTAMGKKFAPAYANIFMANWEQEVFSKCPKKPFKYLRYLDDIWGIWTGSKGEFQEFMNILNSHDPCIKLKFEIHEDSIVFLDTTTFKGPNFLTTHKLDVKVFFKSVDTHALLYKTSFHPSHMFRGIVKSQILRFHRICTRREDFIAAVRTLFKALRGRGYTRSFLRTCFKTYKVRRAKLKEGLIPLITSYSSTNRDLNRKFKSNFERIIGGAGILSDAKIVLAYRRHKNLKDLLVRAKLPSLQSTTKSQLLESQFVRLKFVRRGSDGMMFQIPQVFNTRSANCVYLLFCAKCGIKYVGETKNSLSTRMYQHRYVIRHGKNVETPLVRHFLHHGFESVRMAGLQMSSLWTNSERRNIERYWTHLLETLEPVGLNVKWGTN